MSMQKQRHFINHCKNAKQEGLRNKLPIMVFYFYFNVKQKKETENFQYLFRDTGSLVRHDTNRQHNKMSKI